MQKRLKVTPRAELSMKEAFEEFVNAQSANGRAEQTLQNYRTHFHSISKHIDIEKTLGELKQSDIESMIVSMREHGLAVNSISSYLWVFKTFMNWSTARGYTILHQKLWKRYIGRRQALVCKLQKLL